MSILEAPRRSQAERRDEAEKRLLEATVRLVAERGVEGITLADVGTAAGYSRGLPTHYFGSKSGLIVKLAEHLVEDFLQALAHVERHAPGFERLIGTVRFYFDSARKQPVSTRALFVLLGQGLNNDSIGGHLAELNARSVKEIEVNLAAGIRSKEIRPGIDTKAQATLILAGLRGALSQWLVAPKAINLVRIRDEMVASLTLSLAP